MIRLPYAGTYSLELITAQNGAQVVVCYSDKTATGYDGGTQVTAITSATTTKICDTPASGAVRDIDSVNITNTYAGDHVVTVQVDANGTNVPLVVAALAENGSLHYTHGSGWEVFPATSGSVPANVLTEDDLGVSVQAYDADTMKTDAIETITAAKSFDDGTMILKGSTSGTTTIKASAEAGTTTVTLPAATGTVALTSGIFSGLRNKIVNGCGWIDQQNINAAVTVNSTNNIFGPDKWCGFGQSADGVFTITGSKSVFYPAGKGFPSSIYCQTTTADASIGAAQSYGLRHVIEGNFCADWRLGTANAATVKLRFAARSSLTGTHCVALKNNANDRTYVATYTISSADTWEEKEITIALDTTGTWLATNGVGIKLVWNLGAGSNYETTANTWVAGNYYRVAGCVNVIGTLNATLAITDVDMRLASDSAIYEYRDYQKELDLCQRDYCKTFPMTTAPAQNAGAEGAMNGVNDGITANGYVELCWQYPVRMRAEPTTVTTYNPLAANSNWSTGDAATVGTNTNDRHAYVFSTNTTASNAPSIHIVAEARL